MSDTDAVCVVVEASLEEAFEDIGNEAIAVIMDPDNGAAKSCGE